MQAQPLSFVQLVNKEVGDLFSLLVMLIVVNWDRPFLLNDIMNLSSLKRVVGKARTLLSSGASAAEDERPAAKRKASHKRSGAADAASVRKARVSRLAKSAKKVPAVESAADEDEDDD